jgi:hypothetical protein
LDVERVLEAEDSPAVRLGFPAISLGEDAHAGVHERGEHDDENLPCRRQRPSSYERASGHV